MPKLALSDLTNNSKVLREYTNSTIMSLANVVNNWRRGYIPQEEAVSAIFKTATTVKKEINRLSYTKRTSNLKVWCFDLSDAEELTAAAVMEALQDVHYGTL